MGRNLGMGNRDEYINKPEPHENLYMNVHSRIIPNNQKVETTQMSMNWWLYQLVYPYNVVIFGHKILIHATTWMNFENIMLSERNLHKRPHNVWFHFYEMSRISKSKETESELSNLALGEGRLRANGEWLLMGIRFLSEWWKCFKLRL